MSLASSRSLFLLASIAAALVLGITFYLEYAVGLTPCSLCILQRLCLTLFLMTCLAACVHGPGLGGSVVYAAVGVVFVSGGLALAWYHVLAQSDSIELLPDCLAKLRGADLWWHAMHRALDGAIDCTSVSWTLFRLSIPEWSLLFFIALFISMTYLLLRLAWNALVPPPGDETSQLVRRLDQTLV